MNSRAIIRGTLKNVEVLKTVRTRRGGKYLVAYSESYFPNCTWHHHQPGIITLNKVTWVRELLPSSNVIKEGKL